MAVKASRYLTHIRRLRDPAEPVARLLGAAAGLGPRLGPVLLQLPPNLAADPPLLAACLDQFPAAARAAGTGPVRVAVELRHQSWWAEERAGEVQQVLAARDAALCWADRLGHPVSPLWRTAGWGYLRLPRGRGAAVAAVRPAGAAVLGRADPAGLARRRGRVRLLQQRPGRGGRPRLGHVRRAGPPGRADRHPDPGRLTGAPRPRTDYYLFTGKPRLTPPWLGSSQREVTALPRV